ncbi:MAG: RsmG family class I SAM-dependent methyltransferase [Planctomycetota bacterium]
MGVWQQLRQRSVIVADGIVERFDEQLLDAFLAFLTEQNVAGGFFSAKDSDRILERHLYESIVLVDEITRRLDIGCNHIDRSGIARNSIARSSCRVADVGSGPGLPGAVFGCLHDPPPLTLIDSSRRRLGLVETHLAAQLPTTRFLYRRVEELRGKETDGVATLFDVVVARALAPYPYSVELIARTVAPGGHIVLATAGTLTAPAGAPKLRDLGFERVAEVRLEDLAFLGERHLLYLRRCGTPRRGYPRSWSVIQAEIRRARS